MYIYHRLYTVKLGPSYSPNEHRGTPLTHDMELSLVTTTTGPKRN